MISAAEVNKITTELKDLKSNNMETSGPTNILEINEDLLKNYEDL
jgi:hypothetical protein